MYLSKQDEDIEQDEDELLLITNRVTGSETLFKPPSRLTFCKSPPQVPFVAIFKAIFIVIFIVIFIAIFNVIVIVIFIVIFLVFTILIVIMQVANTHSSEDYDRNNAIPRNHLFHARLPKFPFNQPFSIPQKIPLPHLHL